MLEITAPRWPAFWQSQKLRQHYWHIASSTVALLGHCTSVQLLARFAPSSHYTQLQQAQPTTKSSKEFCISS
jgi:hypothetical protein